MENIFFKDWEGILRVMITTVFAYTAVVIILRTSGKRTLAKMNAYDFIVTVALGSVTGAVILNKSIPLAEGMTAFAFLVFLQFVFTWISVRYQFFQKLVTSKPALLYYNGNVFSETMRKERVTREVLEKSIREAGCADFGSVKAVILEPTGDVTVIKKSDGPSEDSVIDDIIQNPQQ